MRFVHRFFIATATLWLVGCAKELSTETNGNPPIDNANCRIDTAFRLVGDPDGDTVIYVYDSQNKLLEWRGTDYAVTGRHSKMFYTGARLDSNISYSNGTTVTARILFNYNTQNQLRKITVFGYEPMQTPLDTSYYHVLGYTGDLLTSNDVYNAETIGGAGVLRSGIKYEYTGKNITRFILDHFDTDGDYLDTDTIDITYSNKPNPFKASNPNHYFFDPLFFLMDYGFTWPNLLSEGTAMQYAIGGVPLLNFNYDYTPGGRLLNVKENITLDAHLIKYKYSCEP